MADIPSMLNSSSKCRALFDSTYSVSYFFILSHALHGGFLFFFFDYSLLCLTHTHTHTHYFQARHFANFGWKSRKPFLCDMLKLGLYEATKKGKCRHRKGSSNILECICVLREHWEKLLEGDSLSHEIQETLCFQSKLREVLSFRIIHSTLKNKKISPLLSVYICALSGVKSAKSLWSNHLNFRMQRNFLETDASWITENRTRGFRSSTKPDDCSRGAVAKYGVFFGGSVSSKKFYASAKSAVNALRAESKNMSCEWDC